MLRFSRVTETDTARAMRRMRVRSWLLVAALGLVVGAINWLRQPAIQQRTAAFFAPSASSLENDEGTESHLVLSSETVHAQSNQQLDPATPAATQGLSSGVDLSVIKDNTHFRAQENPAWFAILDSLRQSTLAAIAERSVGEVTYAQFISQPDVYRGQVVSVRGTVIREERLDAPPNDLDLTGYHRLIIRPEGGGNWPIIAYVLELPTDFPRGDKPGKEVAVVGVFFKNWSYAWEQGLGLAPVLLAKSISAPPRKTSHTTSPSAAQAPGDSVVAGEEQVARGGFREVLELAGIGLEELSSLASTAEFTDEQWNLSIQLLNRLGQYSEQDLQRWTVRADRNSIRSDSVGEIHEISGTAEEVEMLTLPAELAKKFDLALLHRVRLKLATGDTATILVEHIPSAWQPGPLSSEPIACRAILAQGTNPSMLLVATHLRWYPRSGIPGGQLLLASHGMDAALWSEIKPTGPLESAEKSREAEAFYACLKGIENIPSALLTREVQTKLELLKVPDSKPSTQQAKRLATTLAEQAAQGLSSVVPLFLHPADELGELVCFEGTVRRAVRVAEARSSPTVVSKADYFELELFPPDSQNLPVVCCVPRLPTGFPLGDSIHERVRFEGVFFKGWLYHARKVVQAPSQSPLRARQYTPLVIGQVQAWFQAPAADAGPWRLAAGVAVLVLLVVVWGRLLMPGRRRRPVAEKVDFSNL